MSCMVRGQMSHTHGTQMANDIATLGTLEAKTANNDAVCCTHAEKGPHK